MSFFTIRQIHFFLTVSFLFLACSQSPPQIYYGQLVAISGKVIQKAYTVNSEDFFQAYMIQLEAGIHISPDSNTHLFSYGMDTIVWDLHLDIDHDQIEAFQNQEVQLTGKLVPSETAHHLGPACIIVGEICRR